MTIPALFAMGGDAATAPPDTMVAYWAALAAGCDGLAVHVQCTRDGVLVCAPFELDVSTLSWADVSGHDAGALFRELAPDAPRDARPTQPSLAWLAGPRRDTVRYPLLTDVLRVFGRRTKLVLRVRKGVETLAETLSAFGLLQRIWIEGALEAVRPLLAREPALRWIALVEGLPVEVEELAAQSAGAVNLTCQDAHAQLATQPAALPVWLRPDPGSSAVPTSAMEWFEPDRIQGLLTENVGLSTLRGRPTYEVFRDALQSETLTSTWAAGYSQANPEARVVPRADGLHIELVQGTEYAGGAIVLRDAIHGDFDVTVEFAVKNPQQATTFELAAIALDPPRVNKLNPAQLKNDEVHLSFDVHGAPPYASSERDEDDGYRFGWNNASNLTRIDDAWKHASANMYNQYTRDVGDGKKRGEWTRGSLRLVRCGQIFASYFRDELFPQWVCSGAGLVSAMPRDVFLRVAAKHWRKGGTPPANHVIFRNFVVKQP